MEYIKHNNRRSYILFLYAEKVISASCRALENQLYITISDDGCGFMEEELKRATDSYYSGSGAGNEHHFGLGLYLCKTLCENHGGSLELANNRNQAGACVTASFLCK